MVCDHPRARLPAGEPGGAGADGGGEEGGLGGVRKREEGAAYERSVFFFPFLQLSGDSWSVVVTDGCGGGGGGGGLECTGMKFVFLELLSYRV